MRVCIVPEYPMSLMTGGLQVQAVRTFEALCASGDGISAELFEWSKPQPLADVYHFIGLPKYLSTIAHLVREAKRPYVLTLLFGSNNQPLSLWAAASRRFLKSHLLRQRERYEAVAHAAQVVAITGADAEAARVIYGINKSKIHIVPNGVANEFFQSSPAAWNETFGCQPFVLCVGAVQPRKGQLLLVQACNALKLPLVLLGPVLPGFGNYAQDVEAAMLQNNTFGGRWLLNLDNDNPLLHSAYAACRVFALLSSSETQPLSVMEAMAARKPILLLRAAYTSDPLFNHLPQVSGPSLHQIIPSLQSCWNQAKPTQLSWDFTWPSVATSLQAIYRTIA